MEATDGMFVIALRPESFSDKVEVAQSGQAIEVAAAMELLENEHRAAVNLSLARKDTRCLDCGGEIPPDRLKAWPTAMRCVPCARRESDRKRSR